MLDCTFLARFEPLLREKMCNVCKKDWGSGRGICRSSLPHYRGIGFALPAPSGHRTRPRTVAKETVGVGRRKEEQPLPR
jgi:hypothetical protein